MAVALANLFEKVVPGVKREEARGVCVCLSYLGKQTFFCQDLLTVPS